MVFLDLTHEREKVIEREKHKRKTSSTVLPCEERRRYHIGVAVVLTEAIGSCSESRAIGPGPRGCDTPRHLVVIVVLQ